MKEVNVKVEVHYIPLPPDSVEPNYLKQSIAPIYRLYIDDDLITERKWIWDNSTFIDENLYINAPIDKNHTIKIECLKFQPRSFELKNLRIDGAVVSDQEDSNKLRFTLE